MHHIRKVNEARRTEGKRLAAARWRNPYHGSPTADDLRKRALNDARGMVVHKGATYRGDGRVIAYQIRRSIEGTTDQFDVLLDGRLWRTGGKRLIREWTGLAPK